MATREKNVAECFFFFSVQTALQPTRCVYKFVRFLGGHRHWRFLFHLALGKATKSLFSSTETPRLMNKWRCRGVNKHSCFTSSATSYPALLYEAARWPWSCRMMQSSPQVTRCPHGPRRSSGAWASWAAGGCAGKESENGAKTSSQSCEKK